MRVTRDILINLAHEQAEKMVAKDRSLQCIYLIGSLLGESPFLGGVTDIDLVCVHDRPVMAAREIVRINSEVHLDIAHLQDEVYNPPRHLRHNAWIGGALDEGPLVLYDRFHWFDFVRASASALYWQPDTVAERAHIFSRRARQVWQMLTDEAPQGLKRTQGYIEALTNTVNSLAVLTGSPLTTRRFLLDLPERIERLNGVNFTGSFVALFTSDTVETEKLEKWQSQWLEAFDAIQDSKEIPVQFVKSRRSYYEKAIDALIPDHPAAALWILLTQWTKIAAYLPKSESLYKDWQSFIRALDLDSKGIPDRLTSLDMLLDDVETTIQHWLEENAGNLWKSG